MTVKRQMKHYGVYKYHLSDTQLIFDHVREYYGDDGYTINLELLEGKYIKLSIEVEIDEE